MLFSCYHHARPDQDLPNVYPSFRKGRRASQGTAVRSVAASPAVLPRDAEDFEVVVAMRVITGDGLELHGMMARHGEREGRAKARALLPIVVSHRCR